MCLPPQQPKIKAEPPVGGTKARNALYLAAGLVPLLFLVLPALISEAIGGWTAKYTSNPARFSVHSIPDMTGKVAIVTGGNTGIGFETAKELVLAGAEVILTARSDAKGDAAVARIVDAYAAANPDATTVPVRAMVCDQNSLKSVRQFAEKVEHMMIPVHLLVLNAGVMKSPGAQFVGKNMTYGFDLTEDGFEQHIGVNHIAHHYLTKLLTKPLEMGAPSRVVSVSSSAHSGGYSEGIRPDTWSPPAGEGAPEWYEDGNSYAQSKLANLLFVREFARRSEKSGVTAYAVHPGVIVSDLFRYMGDHIKEEQREASMVEKFATTLFNTIFQQSNMNVRDGALTQLYAATADARELQNGGLYWPVGKLTEPDHPSLGKGREEDERLQKFLWEETEKAISNAL